MPEDCKQITANHHMQSISFESDGFANTAEYFAYVDKGPVNQRACCILECPEVLAQEGISTIGQIIELCFKQYLRNPLKLVTPSP